MIRESVIDKALNRLSSHFGYRIIVRPPATAAQLAELEEVVGALPRDLTIFLSTCNGLRVDADGPDTDLHLWNIHEIEKAICQPTGPPILTGLVPLRGDLMADRDCLVLSPGAAHGTVVRWDAWVPGATLVASTFGHYFDSWAECLICTYDRDGKRADTACRATFDEEFVAGRDPDLKPLAAREDVREWLERIDRAVACGDDYE